MKPFWKKMFWWDAPAKGAFFALTLLLVGAYVLGSVFLFAWEIGWLGRSRRLWPESGFWQVYFLAPFAVLLLYYLFETLCFFFRSGKGWMRYVGVIGLPLWIGFGMALLSCHRHVFGGIVLLWVIAFFAVILPLSACCGKHWRCATTAILTCCIGMFLVWDAFPAFNAVLDPFRFNERLGNGKPEVEVIWIPLAQRLGVSGYGWAAWFALVCLVFTGWYLLTAKLFAGMGNCRFRAMFGRPVLALWGVKILVYLTFSGMVIYEKGQLSHSLAALEQRFSRPMTAEALGELYFGGNQPDAEFWRQAGDWKSERGSNLLFQYPNLLSSPGAKLSDADRQRFRNDLDRPDSTLSRWAQLFSGSIPPPPSEFKEGMLHSVDFSYLFTIRKFDGLLLWRIRFALSDGQIDDALAAYRRMEQTSRLLRHETLLIGGLVWLAAENLRLDGVEMLLESGRLTDRQLQEISAGLMSAELEIPRMQERSLYGEAVYAMDACGGLTTGTLRKDTYDHPKSVPVRVLRYYFPQFWWLCLREKAEIARQFNVPNFSHISSNSSDLSILGEMFLPGLAMGSKRFDELAARVRGMRALIAAELWKREHGEYPDTLPGLPEDPFTGKPLLYRKGESRIQVERFHYNPETENWDCRTEKRTVPAVQVWSPAAGDDGPQNRTRAIRKL